MAEFSALFAAIPGLILFLYGIEHFSREIQHTAGSKFRSILAKLTKTPVKGSILGALLTAIIQSSTATTVITVSLVNAGTLSFLQSLGIMFGANVGTTITGQLIALKLTAFAPFFILAGFILNFTKGKYRILGKPLFYFGLVFYGLTLVSDALIPLKTDPQIATWFASLSSIPIAILAGFLFTVLVQSSSVTTGLVIILAQSGLITLGQGIPLLLGANIGTTTTALLASSQMGLYARRASMANLFFNVGGVIILLPFIKLFTNFIQSLGGSVAQQVANAHTVFNVGAAILFLAGIKKVKEFAEKAVPGEEEEILFKTKYLDEKLPKSNVKAFSLIEKEIQHSLTITAKLFKESNKLFLEQKMEGFMRLEKLETLNDFLDERIEAALLELSRRKLNEKEGKQAVMLIRISNALEQLGDLGEDFGKLPLRLFDKGIHLSLMAAVSVEEIYKAFERSLQHMAEMFPEKAKKHKLLSEKQIKKVTEEKFAEHLERLQSDKEYRGSIFVESLSVMEAAYAKLREIVLLTKKYEKMK